MVVHLALEFLEAQEAAGSHRRHRRYWMGCSCLSSGVVGFEHDRDLQDSSRALHHTVVLVQAQCCCGVNAVGGVRGIVGSDLGILMVSKVDLKVCLMVVGSKRHGEDRLVAPQTRHLP